MINNILNCCKNNNAVVNIRRPSLRTAGTSNQIQSNVQPSLDENVNIPIFFIREHILPLIENPDHVRALAEAHLAGLQQDPLRSIDINAMRNHFYKQKVLNASLEEFQILLNNPEISDDIIAHGVNNNHLEVQIALVRSPRPLSPEQITALISRNNTVRADLARNRNLHQMQVMMPRIVEELSTDTDNAVRAGLAGNPSLHQMQETMPEIATRLARDEEPGVRISLARNPNLHQMPDIATILADDDLPAVRTFVARHPNLHQMQDIATILTRDADRFVRATVARHPNLHQMQDIATILARDEDPVVLDALRGNRHDRRH